MQSAYLCKQQFGLSLTVYIPETMQLSIDFGGDVISVQLDASYLAYAASAKRHAEETLAALECPFDFLVPTESLDRAMPVLSSEWAMMACPRVISEQSAKIGLGQIGPKVRTLVKRAPFPVFIPSMSFKPWTNVITFFGGSPLGAAAVKEGMAIARLARAPFTIHTQLNGITRRECEETLAAAGIRGIATGGDVDWRLYEQGTLEENLFAVPHDSLVVAGAAGHKFISELVFGSKLEVIQGTLPNPLVVVGPECQTPWDCLPGGGA